jgi:hypothetical protein
MAAEYGVLQFDGVDRAPNGRRHRFAEAVGVRAFAVATAKPHCGGQGTDQMVEFGLKKLLSPNIVEEPIPFEFRLQFRDLLPVGGDAYQECCDSD